MLKHKYIALCGAPNSGKTTVGNILVEELGAQIVDDGLMLRNAIPVIFESFGVRKTDPFSQEGKDEIVEVCGNKYTVRQLLGDVGSLLEAKYGEYIMPEIAIKSTKLVESPPSYWVFPSVRKNQGKTYIDHGGIVIEVQRPGCSCVNDFDHYNKDYVCRTVYNNGSLGELRDQVLKIFA